MRCLLIAFLLVFSQSVLAQTLRWDRIRIDAAVLSDDSLQGRGTAQPGGRAAARYLIARLRDAGLRPAGDRGSWEQGFPAHASDPRSGTQCVISASDEYLTLALWDDFILLSHGNQTFIPRAVRIVFAGYGIDAPEYGYSDYKGLDVRGDVVLMLSGEPPSTDVAFFDGSRPTSHASLLAKHMTALRHGARGTIVIPTPREPVFGRWEEWVREFSFEDVRLPYGPPDQLHLVVRLEAARRVLRAEGTSLDRLLTEDSTGSLRPFPLTAFLTFDGKFIERDDWVSNIVAVIPGADSSDASTTVVVGAHYDHLGFGPPVGGDSVYNGYLDNAIGVATTLEIARHLREEGWRPNRTVQFVFFTGEEKGLLGSRFYVDHPLRDLSRTAAMLNIDGISTIGRLRSMIPIGSEYSSLAPLVTEILERHGLRVDEIPPLFSHQNPLVSSDHWSFLSAGIPSLLLSEGLSYEQAQDERVKRFLRYAGELYHTPQDDASIAIDSSAVLQHGQVLLDLVRALGDSPVWPTWNPNSPFKRVSR